LLGYLNISNFRDLNLEIKVKKQKRHQRKILFQDNETEIVLIIWPSNYKTAIHSHPEGGCISKCLQNSVCENRYDVNSKKLIDKKHFYKNNISYIDNTLYYHSIENYSNKISYSLHIYSPPNYYNKNRNIKMIPI
jgi:cysteine dioxygenase